MNVTVSQDHTDFQSLVIPLKRSGRLLLIEADVDGQTGNFVFDTGADKLVLNVTYFRNNLRETDETGGGVAMGSGTTWKTHVDRLQASELIWENLTADVTHLGSIENRRKVKILGLIGISLFAGMQVEIDARNSVLTIDRVDRKGALYDTSKVPDPCDYSGKLKSHQQVLFISGTVGGRTLDFCLDTGAETNVISSAAPGRALETISITSRSELTGAGGGNSVVLYGTMNDFALGDLKFGSMQTIVANLTTLSQAYDYPLSGILGYDFFDQGVICINLVTKEIRITLNEREQQ